MGDRSNRKGVNELEVPWWGLGVCGGALVAGDCNAPNALVIPFKIELREVA